MKLGLVLLFILSFEVYSQMSKADPRCQTIHLNFDDLTRDSDLAPLLERLARDSNAFRTPSGVTESIFLGKVVVDDEVLKLHVLLDSDSIPVSLSFSGQEDDFIDYSLGRDGDQFLIYNRENELVFTLRQERSDIRSNVLSFGVMKPREQDVSLINTSLKRFNLYQVDERWVSSQVPEVKNRHPEWERDFERRLGGQHDFSDLENEQLREYYFECRELNTQYSLSQISSGLNFNCDRELDLEKRFKVFVDMASSDRIESLRSCLVQKNILSQSGQFVIIHHESRRISQERFNEGVNTCFEKVQNEQQVEFYIHEQLSLESAQMPANLSIFISSCSRLELCQADLDLAINNWRLQQFVGTEAVCRHTQGCATHWLIEKAQREDERLAPCLAEAYRDRIYDRDILDRHEQTLNRCRQDLSLLDHLSAILGETRAKAALEGESSRESSRPLEQRLVSLLSLSESSEPKTQLISYYRNLASELVRATFDGDHYLPERGQELSQSLILLSAQRCIDQIEMAPQLIESLNNCYEILESNLYVHKTKTQLEMMVSERLPLTVQAGNQILTPVFDMFICSEQHGATHRKACTLFARTQVAMRLSEVLYQRNQALLGQETISIMKACVMNAFQKFGEDQNINEEGIYTAIGRLFDSPEGLLAYYNRMNTYEPHLREPDHQTLAHFFESLSHRSFNDDTYQQDLEQCLNEVEGQIISGVRDRLVNAAPAVWGELLGDQTDGYQEVLSMIIDHELVDLVLEMQKNYEEQSLNLSRDPRQEQVGQELTIEALAKSVEVISGHLSRGFVFDPDRLKTELVVFREEFKMALRWVNATQTPVRVQELSDFFEQSQLADHLALAEISQQVHQKFTQFINRLEQEELAEFFQSIGGRSIHRLTPNQRAKYEQILARHEALRELAFEMTSSYDFRRIIHQGSAAGRELLNLIKTHSLLPQILGRDPSPTARDEIDRSIAQLIMNDQTLGGFAERFVGIVAQGRLDQQREESWGITLFLFHSDSDFDWEKLRSTEGAAGAVEYYGRYVLLPEMLGHSLTAYERNLRMREFRRYLDMAQGQN